MLWIDIYELVDFKIESSILKDYNVFIWPTQGGKKPE